MSLTEDMFNTLLKVVSNAGEDVNGVNYDKIVNNTYASKVFKEFN